LDGDRYDDSLRAFTTSAIFIHFDAISRVLVVPNDDDTEDLNGGRSPLSLCLATGVSPTGDGALLAALEASSAPPMTSGNQNNETKQNQSNQNNEDLNQLYRESNPKGTVAYPMESLGGTSLVELSETMLIGDPRVAVLRHLGKCYK
jgi:hypothetical protein